MAKRFDEVLYAENTRKSFEALKNSFKTFYPVLRPEDGGIDVAVYAEEKSYVDGASPICFIELEIKFQWNAYEYPTYGSNPDLQFMYKKRRFARLDLPAYYVMYNHDCTNSATINFTPLVTNPFRTKPCTSKITPLYDDGFFLVPRSKVTWGNNQIELRIIKEMANEAMINHRKRLEHEQI